MSSFSKSEASSVWLHELKTGEIFLLYSFSCPSIIFGAITCVTGLLGVVIGAATTRLCRQKTERADPLVCAVSMLGSAIFICLIFVVAKKSIIGAYVRAIYPDCVVYIMSGAEEDPPDHQGRLDLAHFSIILESRCLREKKKC